MKILVISLLRLGDLILQEPLFKGLKHKYPNSEIHVLINDQFLQVQTITKSVDRWWGFPRKKFQDQLVEKPSMHQKAFSDLTEIINSIKVENFDIVYNFTNNYLSAQLMNLLDIKEKKGAHFIGGRKNEPRNRWEDYLNEHFSQINGSLFNYADVLGRALEIPVSTQECRRMGEPGPIYLQTLTSDSKKNWGLKNFAQLKEKLKNRWPRRKVMVLSSPDEKHIIRDHFDDDEILVLNLAEVQQCLKTASLLISGDTSLVHLADQENCPTLGLYLGSGDFRKTGPWQNQGSFILSPLVSCYPCSHSLPCIQKTHLCAQDISIEKVFEWAVSIIEDRKISLKDNQISASEQIEKKLWESYLNQITFVDESFGVPLADECDLSLYISEAQKFHHQIDTALSLGKRIDLESVHHQFRSSGLKLSRNRLDTFEYNSLKILRVQILTNIKNYLERSHGRERSITPQEYRLQA